MNEYKFEHTSGKKGRYVVADTLAEAEKIIGESELYQYELICAWDANGKKTYDVCYSDKNTLPEDVDN